MGAAMAQRCLDTIPHSLRHRTSHRVFGSSLYDSIRGVTTPDRGGRRSHPRIISSSLIVGHLHSDSVQSGLLKNRLNGAASSGHFMIRRLVVGVMGLLAVGWPTLVGAQDAAAEKRVALVVGNAAYQAGALTTPVNDAALIAQTLQAAGFDVVGSRDLDQDTLRHAFRDFIDKVEAAGRNTVALVYLSGFGLQLEGENYFVPVDARIGRDTDVAAEALRISDYTRSLVALHPKAIIFVVDAARASPFAGSGAPLAGGLALVDPAPGMLIAFNAAPGTVAPEEQGPYGPYAQALAEMMREGGLPLAELFNRVRLRVNDTTRGGQVPWHASKVDAPFLFFERTPDAPPPAVSVEQDQAIQSRPIGELGAVDAYMATLERDTLAAYFDFLVAYPDDPLAERVRAMAAVRREAITWRRSRLEDTPAAYWSYLRRYPDGPHVADARRRLTLLAAALEPPQSFTEIGYDVPPPPPEEITYIEQPALDFDDPAFGFAPPPPASDDFLPPLEPDLAGLPPPPPPVALFVLPCPEYRPVPAWIQPPGYVAPPPSNVIYANIHNTVAINTTTHVVTITSRRGETTTLSSGTTAGSLPAIGDAGPALPPSVARKAQLIQTQGPGGSGVQPSGTGQRQVPQLGQPLPSGLPVVPGQPRSPGKPTAGQTGDGHPPAPPTPQQVAPLVPPPQGLSQPRPQPQINQQQQRQGEIEQQRHQQLQLQLQQQRQQELERQRQQEIEQQREQELGRQRQQEIEQQRQQQLLQLQRQQELEHLRQQQFLRQQQIEQQRQQQIEQQRGQMRQQMPIRNCGAPGQPPCPR